MPSHELPFDAEEWAAAPGADRAWPKLHRLVARRDAGRAGEEYRARCGYTFTVPGGIGLRHHVRGDHPVLRERHAVHGGRACARCLLPDPFVSTHPIRADRPFDPGQITASDLLEALRAVRDDTALLDELRRVALAAGRNPDWPCDWASGGCLVLAEGLRRAVGHGELVGASDEYAERDEEYTGDETDHVAWQVWLDGENLLVDAHGVHDGERAFLELLTRRGMIEPVLFPYKVSDHRDDRIPFEEGLADRLADALRAELAR